MVTASEIGKKGGQAKSEAKAAAARKNASKPRGKWVTFVHYTVDGADGKEYGGCFSWRGKLDLDLKRNGDMLQDLITEHLIAGGHQSAIPWKQMHRFGGMQDRVV